jgi:hypothetical protein
MGRPEDLTAKPVTEADVRRIIRETLVDFAANFTGNFAAILSRGKLPPGRILVETIFLHRLRAFVDNPTDPIQGAHTIRLGLLAELDRLLS